ncbi:MAG: DNA polymerase-3 subunit alpha (Gram-positive type) [Candidatus Woesearchaeota archaeon]|jgi:DNA polymerase-3 subunit alpha (Gram-positive type)
MDLVIVDIETTGLSRRRHSITEIAAIKLKNGEVHEKFSTLVNPQCPIPKFITKLTGITDSMVSDAPVIKDAMQSFIDFTGNHTILAHNAAFDHGFLAHNALEELEHQFDNPRLCTRKLASRLLPELESKKLSSICDHLAITNEQAHRAMADVHVTHKIFSHMTTLLAQKGIIDLQSIQDFESLPVQKAIRFSHIK